jgi:4-hydroxy-tetrahydrodipicolinate synthase
MGCADGLRERLIAAVPVPFDAEGKLHREAQDRLVAHLAAEPVGGVAVWGRTGRGLALSTEQRAEVLTSWRRGIGPGRLVLAGVGSPPRVRLPELVFQEARAMAGHAADLGADALVAYPPVAFRGRSDQDQLVIHYHAAIAEAGLPVVLIYLHEAAGGIAYGPHLLAQLLARAEVLGLVVATLDRIVTFQQVARLVRTQAPEKLLITGEDRFLGYSLMGGARSALIGMAAACPRLPAALLRSYWSGDATRFLALNGRVDELAQYLLNAPTEGSIQRILWCLAQQGVIPSEATYDPWGPRLSPAERNRIAEFLNSIDV